MNISLDPRLHFVVATAVIVKGNKFLIIKRAPHEKAFPNKWTVPGGKLVTHEYRDLPKVKSYDGWYNVVDWVLRKEIKEEVNLQVRATHYLCDVVYIRPDGYPVVTLSYWAEYKSGRVKISKDFTDYAWITLDKLGDYDLIEGIDNEIRQVAKSLDKNFK